MTNTNLQSICTHFTFEGTFSTAIPYGDGHINDTYKVTYTTINSEPINYILQRVNHIIFTNTVGLMENIQNVTSYLNDMIIDEDLGDYEILALIKTTSGGSYYIDDDGNYWRSYVFVENATGHTFAKDSNMLYEAGRAFGQFQRMLGDYPVKTLHETIEGFHNTANRYKTFIDTLESDTAGRASDCTQEINFIKSRAAKTNTITSALKNGDIPYRVTHNDTKINNVLLDDVTGIGRCVIDLDTVMPGSALYDYGDAIRSCGSTLAEDATDLDNLELDVERFEAYTKGFLEIIGSTLTSKEIALLPASAILMTLECGMRFLTDHLDGDNYFKIHHPGHNLERARNQFKYVEVMEKNIDQMTAIVNKYT